MSELLELRVFSKAKLMCSRTRFSVSEKACWAWLDLDPLTWYVEAVFFTILAIPDFFAVPDLILNIKVELCEFDGLVPSRSTSLISAMSLTREMFS